MRSSNPVFSATLDTIRPVVWSGQAVYLRHAQLVTALREQLGEVAASFLTEPSVSEEALAGNARAHWYSETMQSPVSFTSLPQEEQLARQEQVASLLGTLEDFARSLREKEDDEESQHLGEALLLALQTPSLDYLMVEGDSYALVGWGFTSEEAKRTRFTLTQAVRTLDGTPAPSMTKTAAAPQPSAPEPSQPPKPEPPAAPPSQPIVPPKQSGKKPWLVIVLILLVLALLAALIYLLLQDRVPAESVLPETPGLVSPETGEPVASTIDPAGRMVVADRLHVYLSVGTDMEDYARRLVEAYGDEVRILGYRPEINLIQVQVDAAKRTEWIDTLKEMPGVEDVFEDHVTTTQIVPSDPGFQEVTGHESMYWGLEAIGAFQAWERSTGDPDVVIAVIDSGFQVDHPEFQGKVLSTWNSRTGGTDVSSSPDNMEHGTHVAGIAAANNDNGQGVCGVCPDCSLILIRAADDNGWFDDAALIDGIYYAADNGANVVNISVGQDMGDLTERWASMSPEERAETHNYIVQNTKAEAEFWNAVFTDAARRGLIVVQATGNEDLPCELDPMKRVTMAINVNAVDERIDKAGFSNYGLASTVSAPGVNIYSSVPGSRSAYNDGTSMASPMVAGAVGYLLSINPGLSYQEVVNILLTTGTPLSNVRDEKYIGPLIQLTSMSGDPVEPPGTPMPNPDLSPGQPTPPVQPPAEDCLCGEELQELLDQLAECQPQDPGLPPETPPDQPGRIDAPPRAIDQPAQPIEEEIILDDPGEEVVIDMPPEQPMDPGQDPQDPLHPNPETPIMINLNWEFLPGARGDSDLDLGSMFVLSDGYLDDIQPLDIAEFHQGEHPFVYLDRDDRSGREASGETLYFEQPMLLDRAMVYTFIFKGTDNFSAVNARVEITYGSQRIIVPLDNPDPELTFCSVCTIVRQGDRIIITREEKYFPDHRKADEHYGFGFEWVEVFDKPGQ